jgi:hypothetical protein
MKIQFETALFQVPFGSHLYGTSTPTSDYDYKVVCLPSFEDLLMNKKLTNRVKKPDGWKPGDKMLEGEAEYEFIPLQVYLDHFFEGQTYAIETAFAVLNDMHTTLEYEHGELSIKDDSLRIQAWMSELMTRFLTRDVQKMVGYAVAQSRQYGLKTERYNSYVAVAGLVGFNADMKKSLAEDQELLYNIMQIPHIKSCTVMNGAGGDESAPGIEIGGKQFPLTTKWAHVLSSVTKSVESYGNRVKDHTGQPADWKALSHATRIVEQIIELTQTGHITFPRPNADVLLMIKRGEFSLDYAKDMLADRFNLIDTSIESSVLNEKTPELEEQFYEFKLRLLKDYYGL